MKKAILLSAVAGLMLVSCNKPRQNPLWEYRIITIVGSTPFKDDADGEYKVMNDMSHKGILTKELQDSLDVAGRQGWELVDIVPFIETVYPNFGDVQYHTGVKTNTRTYMVRMFLKRATEK